MGTFGGVVVLSFGESVDVVAFYGFVGLEEYVTEVLG